MNISYNWLKDLVKTNLSPTELAQMLTNAGLAVEGIEQIGNDFIFDFDLTSNRPDCLSHFGIAREIAAIDSASQFTSKPANSQSGHSSGDEKDLVTIQDPDLCHRFTARIIRNVKIAPSPDWLISRLEAVGERAINNVADITNYVMLELGQPMHAFDLSKLAESRIVVRRARSGEIIKTLDEIERKLDENMLAICDAEKPVAVAGIMGGEFSGITEDTTDVLLEVAYFQRESIRRTSRALNLSTEASYRFERGVDIENLIRASNRATELICELAGGEAGEFIDVYPKEFVPNEIVSDDLKAETKRLTGLDVDKTEIERILGALGIERKSETFYLSPSWRYDIAIEEDLVEEVARVYGYEKIAEELPPAFSSGGYQPNETKKKLLRRTLVDLGFDEAISYSFINEKHDERFSLVPGLIDSNAENKFVSIKDPIIEGATRMRPTLLPGLLDAVRTNFNHQNRNLRLFEVGRAFAAKAGEDGLPHESELFSLVLTGGETWQKKAVAAREFDFYDAKGALEAALEAVGFSDAEFAVEEAEHLRKGQSAAVSIDGCKIGYLGRIADDIAAQYKFRQPVFAAEIDLGKILELKTNPVLYRPLPKYPSVSRDISLLVKRSVSFDDLRSAISAHSHELCRGVEFVDVYEGKGVADDERSITLRLEYRSDQRTLLDEEVDEVHSRIVKDLEQNFGAVQR